MIMDENGRNGEKWHLAQQTTQPVIALLKQISCTNTIKKIS